MSEIRGCDVLLEVADMLRARRDDVVALVEHPGKRELGGPDALLARDLVYAGDELEISPEILSPKTGMIAAKVAGAVTFKVVNNEGIPQLKVTFTKSGNSFYPCTIPGHAEAGNPPR